MANSNTFDIQGLIADCDQRIAHYSKVSRDVIKSAANVKDYRKDPYEAQRILIMGTQIQNMVTEYTKIAANLHALSLAHQAARQTGFESEI